MEANSGHANRSANISDSTHFNQTYFNTILKDIKFSSALTLRELSSNIVASSDGLKYLMISLRPDTQIGRYYQISQFRLDVSIGSCTLVLHW